ncbi:MAG TPA: adenylyl-sulfate kinase [Chloroflexota bacterium]
MTQPQPRQGGACIWLTGLSGAGKSTTAERLTTLLEQHGRRVTLLDGDVVRTHLSQGLGFSKEDRDTNVRRIGFVAGEIVRHAGIAVCAVISPYRATRDEVRQMVGPEAFVEVFVSTPLDECERRDVKGMYAAARRGEIAGWTGIDDPYEPPAAPELTLETVTQTVDSNALAILAYLQRRGFVCPSAAASAPGGTASGDGTATRQRGPA